MRFASRVYPRNKAFRDLELCSLTLAAQAPGNLAASMLELCQIIIVQVRLQLDLESYGV